MAGQKSFYNFSSYALHVTLMVRAGDDVPNSAGTVEFDIAPKETKSQAYGGENDAYLNGILMSAPGSNGETVTCSFVVTDRGDSIDNELNCKDEIYLQFEGDGGGGI